LYYREQWITCRECIESSETGTADIRQDINIVHCSIIHFTKTNPVIDNIPTSIYCRDYTARVNFVYNTTTLIIR